MYPALEIDLHLERVCPVQTLLEGCVWGHRSAAESDSNEGTNLRPLL